MPCTESPSNGLEGEPFLLHGRQEGPGVDAIVEIPPLEGKKNGKALMMGALMVGFMVVL